MEDLAEKGYCVIENILSEEELQTARNYFYEWLNSDPQIKAKHDKISPHGIFKHFEAGHQRHAWYIRTRPKVLEAFKKIWKTDELVVSFDGACWISKDVKKRDNVWTHTDQAPSQVGLKCYQGFVSLTDNVDRSLVVYEGSHKLHAEYCAKAGLTHNKNWQLIDIEYLEKIKETKRVLHVKAGSLVIWDSRTFHQNQYGSLPEERIVQYVSYLPKEDRSEKMEEKRIEYFLDRRTTSHWAYPVKVNGLQPQHYGKKELLIDYKKLIVPYLDDMLDDILELI
jgi:ectoine hydroxylase-related dioxygenase (phytanoyl-CoA dioxygenase family)